MEAVTPHPHRYDHKPTPALLRGFIVALLLGYAIASFLTELRPPFRERRLIPLFSWFIFHTAPQDSRDFTVLFRGYDGRSLDPPLLFGEAWGIVADPRSSQAADLFRRWGHSLRTGDSSDAKALRRIFESSFLHRPAEYELVEISFDPVERWKAGHYAIERRWPYAFTGTSP